MHMTYPDLLYCLMLIGGIFFSTWLLSLLADILHTLFTVIRRHHD